MKFDTEGLKAVLDAPSVSSVDMHILYVAHVYHLSRCADALEGIMATLEGGQIATLEGENIVKRLSDIHRTLEATK